MSAIETPQVSIVNTYYKVYDNKRMIHSSVYKRLPSPNEIMYCSLNHEAVRAAPSADPEGGGAGGPAGKSQIIWVSIGNKQLDTPWKKLNPLEKIGPHLEP